MAGDGPGGRLRRVAIRSVIVLIVGAAILVPILYYASTVDVRPPQVDRFTVTQHLPGNDSVALTTASLELVFSEAVRHASAQDAFAITPAVSGAFSWNGNAMVFTPAGRLPLETRFSVRLAPGVRDLAGNAMGAGGPFTFRTVGGPSVVSTDPGAHATDVPLDATVTVTFSTLMDTASVQRALQVLPETAVDLRWQGEKLTIVPRQLLAPDRTYTVLIDAAATDLAGTALTESASLQFTTVTAGLHALNVVPRDASQGIAVTTPIAVILDRAVDPASVGDRLLTIQPATVGSLTLTAPEGAAGLGDGARRILRFTPSGPLPANTTFTVTLAAGLRAVDGTRLAVPLSWSFTTGSPSPSLSNQVVFLSDRAGVSNLWAMNPDGSNQRQLSAELSPVTGYAIAPDGHSFVVGDGARLVEQGADGLARRVLTEAGRIEFDPSYSPDGSTIVFGRADAATGAGLGLWRRPSSGGAAQAIEVPGPSPAKTPTAVPPAAASAAPSAAASPATPATLLRAPRYSPDGKQLAFIDMGGHVEILDLEHGSLTSAPFHAVSPPAWLPDGTGVLLSGVYSGRAGAGWATGVLAPRTPVAPLTPAGLGLDRGELASSSIVEFGPGSVLVSSSLLPLGATLPAVAPDGRIAYILPDPRLPDAGTLWIAEPNGVQPRLLHPDDRALARSFSFAPEAGILVVSREPIPGPRPTPAASPSLSPSATATPSAGASASAGASPLPSVAPSAPPVPTATPSAGFPNAEGIWLVDTATGTARQLSADGRMPRWIP